MPSGDGVEFVGETLDRGDVADLVEEQGHGAALAVVVDEIVQDVAVER